jgi:hypothetical protein
MIASCPRDENDGRIGRQTLCGGDNISVLLEK